MSEDIMSDAKPVVHYRMEEFNKIVVGSPAFVTVTGHPRRGGEHFVRTSTVVKYGPTLGSFETLNTKYVPVEEIKP